MNMENVSKATKQGAQPGSRLYELAVAVDAVEENIQAVEARKSLHLQTLRGIDANVPGWDAEPADVAAGMQERAALVWLVERCDHRLRALDNERKAAAGPLNVLYEQIKIKKWEVGTYGANMPSGSSISGMRADVAGQLDRLLHDALAAPPAPPAPPAAAGSNS
jgi:hypothetical protein